MSFFEGEDVTRIQGFSKLPKEEKIRFVAHHYLKNNHEILDNLKSFWHPDPEAQKVFDEFSENTISNFYTPFECRR